MAFRCFFSPKIHSLNIYSQEKRFGNYMKRKHKILFPYDRQHVMEFRTNGMPPALVKFNDIEI